MQKRIALFYKELVRRLTQKEFLEGIGLGKGGMNALLAAHRWKERLSDGLFVDRLHTCTRLLELCRPAMEELSTAPKEGWLPAIYQLLIGGIFPQSVEWVMGEESLPGARLYLETLSALLEEEQRSAAFDPRTDFAFLSPEELESSNYAQEYARFVRLFGSQRMMELMRIGREIKPFDTLGHIAGVHHIAMHVGRQIAQAGLPIDLALLSGAAAGHDIGKFGCRSFETHRIPYLHYYYTDLWFTQNQMPAIGHVATNHSTWDLELENLPLESLVLIYADFRVKRKGSTWEGKEKIGFYTLDESFQVILDKLDNVDAAKEQRYRHVYAKLHDFEDYMEQLGVNTDLTRDQLAPVAPVDLSLRSSAQSVETLKYMAIEHNIRLMHTISREISFGNMMEDARSQTEWKNIRAYLNIFEEYFTYMTQKQKVMTLGFLYELLMHGEGDIRRQAAALMGRMIVRYDLEYRKELPEGVHPSPDEVTGLTLWKRYLREIIFPDHKITATHKGWIGTALKLVVDAAFRWCRPGEAGGYLRELLTNYTIPDLEDGAAAALADAALYIPQTLCTREDRGRLLEFCVYLPARRSLELDAGVLRLLLALAKGGEDLDLVRESTKKVLASMVRRESVGIAYLQLQIARLFGLKLPRMDWWEKRLFEGEEAVSEIFLENLKTATPWVIKEVNISFLLDQIHRGAGEHVLHVATHLSNLIKVSERVVVDHRAGDALMAVAPLLTLDQRNEIAIELTKGLEMGEYEFSKDMPTYLGRFALFLHPQELDEVIDELGRLVKGSNPRVAPVAITTLGTMLQQYAAYRQRFPQDQETHDQRRRVILGMILSGLAHYHEPVSTETFLVVSRDIFGFPGLSDGEKRFIFRLIHKKVVTLLAEQERSRLSFFNNAACLNHIYRFITNYTLAHGPFDFPERQKVAFFPGTFDPFSLSHKAIVRQIRNMGFTVYLSLDEFSWSKRTQPRLVRRKIVNMSVADLFHVYLFPDDIPVNIANPRDLRRLRELFPDKELYIAVGSDVIWGASSYKAAPTRDSVHHFNHIIFRRNREGGYTPEEKQLLDQRVLGRRVDLALAPYLEEVSSTRIRENIDCNRDISNLIDPVAQKYLYDHSLYLRSPQYKTVLEDRPICFRLARELNSPLLEKLEKLVPLQLAGREAVLADLHRSASRVLVMEDGEDGPLLGFTVMHQIPLANLYEEFHSTALAEYIRGATSGKIVVITGLYAREDAGVPQIHQQLLTETLAECLRRDYTFAVYHSLGGDTPAPVLEVLEGQNFRLAPVEGVCRPVYTVDMKFPIALIQDLDTIIRTPLNQNPQVLEVCLRAHRRLQQAMARLYPGSLVLTFTAREINRRLMDKITHINEVPSTPLPQRVLGRNMCVPYGKILRGMVVPNTVTKSLHTEKVFDHEIKRFTVEEYPDYSPLRSQIRTIKSFDRPVLLVDDLLHKGYRLRELDPLFKEEGLPVKKIIVGIMSGRGKDLMAIQHRSAESVYFLPNLRLWFVESNLYPFIGGESVRREGRRDWAHLISVNQILPYSAPSFIRGSSSRAIYDLSMVCLENAREILQVLEREYQHSFERNLTLSRLSEALVYPRLPDKGSWMIYDSALPPSQYVDSDIQLLRRLGTMVPQNQGEEQGR